MITSLLIANRGEIACRIIRTARKLGIRTVAVYSEADAQALHVRSADEAMAIGPAPARESYLVGERIIAAAKSTGAEAIHPGYGFLSENADFAQSVIDAGLVWVGPRPDSIRAMGLKDAAKQRMIAAGVPVTPGYLGEDQSPATLQSEADAIGYPVLIKAVAGGGGKGMRRVEAAADFSDALASCQREAASSFGDDRVLIEKYIQSPRHIEVQIFGDTHGHVVHLFERDCSLQRRHQKVVEEAPAPGMDERTREAVCAAAVKAAQAVDYVGAGTIEFIADASEGLRADRIWFMEMNTRLQVEHPVTEAITGQDLVEWQLRVASGEPLPKRQDELAIDGWAIEARLYAEDPAKGFLPSVGPLTHFAMPNALSRANGPPRHARVDTGVQQGDRISPFYDPMIAKLIVHARDRTKAIHDLSRVCSKVRCWPVVTNASFLNLLLRHEDVAEGRVDTGLIARDLDRLMPKGPSEKALQSVATVAVDRALGGRPTDIRDTYLYRPSTAWSQARGFRMNGPQAPTTVKLREGQDDFAVEYQEPSVSDCLWVDVVDNGYLVVEDGNTFLFRDARAEPVAGAAFSDGTLAAPMPGRIVAVEVEVGEAVTKGQRIVVIEAMKMEQALLAPFDGTVAELGPAAGAQVSEGTLLARIEATEA